MAGGSFHLFHWRGVPVQLHWSAPALAVVAVLSARASLIAVLGAVAIVVVHEIGHAVLVKRFRLRAVRIVIHAFGGECWHEGSPSMRERVVIAWGGVLAQGVLFVWALGLAQLDSVMRIGALRELLGVLTGYNALSAAFNLLPIRPLDGHTAWKLKHLWRPPGKRAKTRSATSRPMSRAEKKSVERVVDDALQRARASANSHEDPR